MTTSATYLATTLPNGKCNPTFTKLAHSYWHFVQLAHNAEDELMERMEANKDYKDCIHISHINRVIALHIVTTISIAINRNYTDTISYLNDFMP